MLQNQVGRRKCFTLIELMVVLAIILTLAALLLPGLRAAKAKARQLLCLVNTKQITIAAWMYANDRDEWFPYVDRFYSNWMQGLATYVGGWRPVMVKKQNEPDSPMQWIEIFNCPETKNRQVWSIEYWPSACYGWNWRTTSGGPGSDPARMYQYVKKATSIRYPSRMVLIFDSMHVTPEDFTIQDASVNFIPDSHNPPRNRGRHHNRFINYAFVDGSAQGLRKRMRKDLLMGDQSTYYNPGHDLYQLKGW